MRTDLSLVAADFPLPQTDFPLFPAISSLALEVSSVQWLGKSNHFADCKTVYPIQFRRLHFHDMFSHKP